MKHDDVERVSNREFSSIFLVHSHLKSSTFLEIVTNEKGLNREILIIALLNNLIPRKSPGTRLIVENYAPCASRMKQEWRLPVDAVVIIKTLSRIDKEHHCSIKRQRNFPKMIASCSV